MKRFGLLAVAAMSLFVARPAVADTWDQFGGGAGSTDSGPWSTNELVHGSSQFHDLDPANSGLTNDEDWYFISLKPYSSYEVIVDGTTPYINRATPVSLTLVQSDGTVDTTDYAASSRGFTRSLRLGNNTATVNDDRWVRMFSGDCGASCLPVDTYQIFAQETTLLAPRYNNSGTQITILVVQNPTGSSVSGMAHFFNAAGALVTSSSLSIPANGAVVLNTSTVAPASSGSIVITNNAPYGALAGKAVALEPSTGFTFDTTLVPRFQ